MQARTLMKNGEDRLKRKFNWFGGDKREEALEMFKHAATNFQLAKDWLGAGQAFAKQADCYILLDSKNEAAASLVRAATFYKKVDLTLARAHLKQAIDYYADMGAFRSATGHQKTLAEMFESSGEIKLALEAFQLAADYYQSDGETNGFNQCRLKVAFFSAQLEQYETAIKLYEEIATIYLESSLLKFSARDCFLRAGLCQLCRDDLVSSKRALLKYKELDVTFGQQRECQLLEDLIAAYEQQDADTFTQIVREYDETKSLGAWKVNLLWRIKQKLMTEESDLI